MRFKCRVCLLFIFTSLSRSKVRVAFLIFMLRCLLIRRVESLLCCIKLSWGCVISCLGFIVLSLCGFSKKCLKSFA